MDSNDPQITSNDATTAGNDTSKATDNTASLQEQLADLTAQATALYAVKQYEEAAELYSQATELQAEANGEMAEENADLLFVYGRCLFHVAQKTSTVLGGTAASARLKGNEKKRPKKRTANGNLKSETQSAEAGPSTSLQPVIETAEPADVLPIEEIPTESNADPSLFQISGDAANWDDSGEEEGSDAEEGEDSEQEEQEDDFQTAFEILDTSRILYLRKLETQKTPNESTPEQTQALTELKTRIADIYDLQAEISLEGEEFSAAVSDLKSCLSFKQDIYPQHNGLIAECHYKLSLALEAASQIQQRGEDGNPVGEITIDWKLRDEAAVQQEKAIESTKLRIQLAEADLAKMTSDKDKEKLKEEIDDVQDMTNAMEQRLSELKAPPISVKAEAEKDAQTQLMGTMLGQILGAGKDGDKQAQQQKLAEVIAGANDLTGIVKKKKPKPVNGNGAVVAESKAVDTEVNGKGKRKLEDVEQESTPSSGDTTVKKVRIEDVID